MPRPKSKNPAAVISFLPSHWLRPVLDRLCLQMAAVSWPVGDPLANRHIGYKNAIEYSVAVLGATFAEGYIIIDSRRMIDSLANKGLGADEIKQRITDMRAEWGLFSPIEKMAATSSPVVDAATGGADHTPDLAMAEAAEDQGNE